jgi:hypothetical protein
MPFQLSQVFQMKLLVIFPRTAFEIIVHLLVIVKNKSTGMLRHVVWYLPIFRRAMVLKQCKKTDGRNGSNASHCVDTFRDLFVFNDSFTVQCGDHRSMALLSCHLIR